MDLRFSSHWIEVVGIPVDENEFIFQKISIVKFLSLSFLRISDSVLEEVRIFLRFGSSNILLLRVA